jgi:hypothetical protein
MPDRVVLAEGVLNWAASERVSDRYGYVYVQTGGDFIEDAEDELVFMMTGNPRVVTAEFDRTLAGSKGRLLAEVVEVRPHFHIGDLFHGVGPSVPAAGEVVPLSRKGSLTFGEKGGFNAPGGKVFTVGVRPPSGRERLWLELRGLYRVHNQRVRLLWEPA